MLLLLLEVGGEPKAAVGPTAAGRSFRALVFDFRAKVFATGHLLMLGSSVQEETLVAAAASRLFAREPLAPL